MVVRRSLLVIVAGLLFIGILRIVRPTEKARTLTAVQASQAAAPSSRASQPITTPFTAQAARLPPQEALALPSLSSVVDEVKENPHVTPPSLLEFATRMGENMETALRSEP